MNLILGINAFHPDSSACVLKDGQLVAANLTTLETVLARHNFVELSALAITIHA